MVLLLSPACGDSHKASVDTGTEDVLPTDPSREDVTGDDVGLPDALDATDVSDPPHDVVVDAVDATPDAIDAEEDGPCSTTAWLSYAATDTPITIPDDDETGVESTLVVDDCDIEVNDIRVDVDITHPFIGDLKVKLMTPAGREIYLHDRSGTISDDIITTYPTSTIPAQTICVLVPVSSSLGSWRLVVSDNGAGDVGTLNSWSIMLNGTRGYCPHPRYDSTDTFPMAIPDWDTAGITSQINVGDSGSIVGIDVLVNIDHEWIGDVRVSLESPDSHHVLLYDSPGGPGSYLATIFPMETAPLESLTALHGREKNGIWRLHVADLDPTLVGSLLGWAIYIY
jgi:subtilisin-like proprotein convertase family protein